MFMGETVAINRPQTDGRRRRRPSPSRTCFGSVHIFCVLIHFVPRAPPPHPTHTRTHAHSPKHNFQRTHTHSLRIAALSHTHTFRVALSVPRPGPDRCHRSHLIKVTSKSSLASRRARARESRERRWLLLWGLVAAALCACACSWGDFVGISLVVTHGRDRTGRQSDRPTGRPDRSPELTEPTHTHTRARA